LTVRILINARNRSIAVEGDRIVEAGGRFDVVIDCPRAEVRPGLINGHDHLHRNHYGRLGNGPYPSAYRWADDIQTRFRRRIARHRRLPRRAALLSGAWKNLFAGVTTVVHHDPWERDFDRDFPLRVARVASADSLGMATNIQPPPGEPFCLHLAEGIDAAAAREVEILDERGLLNDRLIAVHGVAVDGSAIDKFCRSGAALVWCPTSNEFLFGRTASPQLLDGGCDVILGSDSRLTGRGDLLDELRAARAYRILDDARLADAVGRTCARRLGIEEPLLEPGTKADLILIERPLAEATSNDVALTMVDGVPRVAKRDMALRLGKLAERGSAMRVGRRVRWTYQQERIG
jgi:cytosine/adenosine deaminase-related metal-dependent hydrolase